MSSKNQVSEELTVINLVRSFSILAVMAQHVGFNCRPPAWGWLANAWASFAFRGMYGVTIFFLISGFLITRSLALKSEGLFQPNFRRFYVSRFGRIFPLLAAVLLFVAILLSGPFAQPSYFSSFFKASQLPMGWTFWTSILTFSFNWNMILNEKISPTGYGIFWVFWSLSIEEQFYFVYPLLLKTIRTKVSFVQLLFFIVLLGPLVRLSAYVQGPDLYFLGFMNSFGCFDLIALGALLYLCQEKWGEALAQDKVKAWALVGMGAVLSFGAYFHTAPQGMDRVWAPTLLGLGVFLFLLGAMNVPFFNRPLFRWAGLPGKWSYGLYLLHVTVLYFLWPWVYSQDAVTAYLGFCSVCFIVAYLSYRFFEVPVNLWIRQKLSA